jgi:uncharacterized protein YggE
MVNLSGMRGEARRLRHSGRDAAQSVGPPLLLLLLVNINSNNLAAMKTLVVCAFALVPLTVVAAGSEVAGLAGLPNQPFLYVEGKAEIEKAPDLISLHFDISGRNADQGKANQEVQAKAKKLFALLKEAKIEDRDVVAQDLRSEPEYQTGRSRSKQAW